MTGFEPQRPADHSQERGQTLIDYVAGISVFFITLALVLTLLPSFVNPYQSDVAGEDTAQAERISQQLVGNLSIQGEPNRLDLTSFRNMLALSGSALNDRYGVPDHKNINVTVRTMNGTTWIEAGGDNLTSKVTYDGQSAATRVRIVRFDGGTANCDPACRLLVRVW